MLLLQGAPKWVVAASFQGSGELHMRGGKINLVKMPIEGLFGGEVCRCFFLEKSLKNYDSRKEMVSLHTGDH